MKTRLAQLQKNAIEIVSKTKALSVFIYGSVAKGEHKANSDIEGGVVYRREDKLSRDELAKYVTDKKVHLYPFVLQDLRDNRPETPFPNRLFLYEIIKTSKNLAGEDVIGRLRLPEINTIHLIDAAAFERGSAFSALMILRNGDQKLAAQRFAKSVFFTFRIAIILSFNTFAVSYAQVADYARKLELEEEYKKLLAHAQDARNNGKVSESVIMTLLKFQSRYLAPILGASLKDKVFSSIEIDG